MSEPRRRSIRSYRKGVRHLFGPSLQIVLALEVSDTNSRRDAKRSMFVALLSASGMREDQAVYLDVTAHMSGVDPLLGVDRAVRAYRVRDGDAVLLLSAGTGYTWAATVMRWGAFG